MKVLIKMGMYRTVSLIAILAGLLFTTCMNGNTQLKSAEGISGRFINQSFLDQIPDSIAASIQGYCYEMYFISPDSVAINYGYEQGTLAYKQEGDKYVLLSAIQGRNLLFALDDDSTLTIMDSVWVKRDTAWIGTPLNSKFRKVADIKAQKWVFDQYLNEKSIVGTYHLYKQGRSVGQNIVFTKDGKVSGLENYDSYEICFSGDCIGEVEKPSNIISFRNEKNESVSYVFKIDKKNKLIHFNAIGDQLKDADDNPLKGGRSIKQVVFTLKVA